MLERAIEMVVQPGDGLGVAPAAAPAAWATRAPGAWSTCWSGRGIVSGHEGSKPRTVLIGEGDLDRIIGEGTPALPEPVDDVTR